MTGREIDTLIDTFLDGEASQDDRDRLAAWLGDGPANRDRFVKRSRLHWSLRGMAQRRTIDMAAARITRASTDREEPVSDPVRAEPGTERANVWARYGSILAAAAIVVFACAAVVVYTIVTAEEEPINQGPAFVSVIDSTGDLYMGDGIGRAGGDYPGGSIELTEGSAEFLLSNRVSVRLHGATRLTMSTPMSATMHAGRAVFTCPAEASGFTVHLPGGWSVVDLSTAFEVIVRDDGRLGVVATEGLIELRAPGGDATRLVAGQGRVIDANGRLAVSDPWLTRKLGVESLRRMDGLVVLHEFNPNDDQPKLMGGASIADAPLEGQALTLEGDGHARTGALNLAGSFSFAAWVRPDRIDPTFNSLVMTDAWGPTGVHWQIHSGRPELAVGPNTIFTANEPLAAGEWRHLAATVDRESRWAVLYVDGERVAELGLAPDSQPEVREASIGMWTPASGPARPFVGLIDDLAVFDRALGDDEIRLIHETTQLRSEGTADPPRARSERGAAAEDGTE